LRKRVFEKSVDGDLFQIKKNVTTKRLFFDKENDNIMRRAKCLRLIKKMINWA
jgi:hypothetical protein